MLDSETLVVPLKTDQDGVVRLDGTRVRLATIVYAFNEGATPEEIVSQYPVLRLLNVYAVIAYYLKNRVTVDTYLRKHQADAARIRAEIQSRPENKAFRERIIARRRGQR